MLNRAPFSFVGASKVLFEDWLCWSLLAGKGRFLYLPDQLTLCRVHGGSITSRLTQSSVGTKSVASLWAVRLQKLYAGLEFKMVLLARSDTFLEGLRVAGSIAEDLRLILIAYLWNPGSNPDRNATLQPNALVKLLMLPFRLARCSGGWIGAGWFRR